MDGEVRRRRSRCPSHVRSHQKVDIRNAQYLVDGCDWDGDMDIDWNDQFYAGPMVLINGIDLNNDHDTFDTIGIDGGILLWSVNNIPKYLWDDELEYYISSINVCNKVLISQPCFSGEMINDFSNNQDQPTGQPKPAIWDDRITITACNNDELAWCDERHEVETDLYVFSAFTYFLFNALERNVEDRAGYDFEGDEEAKMSLDTNFNDIVSLVEAFNYMSNIYGTPDTPQLDDNYDEVSSDSKSTDPDLPDRFSEDSDGYLGSNSYL